MSPGHVFVTRGDLTRVCCDAWLLPGDGAGHVARDGWFANDPELAVLRRPDGVMAVDLPPASGFDEQRTIQVHEARGFIGAPWLTNTGASGAPPVWYAEGVRQFLHEAVRVQPHSEHGRSQPLFGIPLVGTGFGGADEFRGDVVEAVVGTMYEFTSSNAADVALVLADDRSFAAAQFARRRLVKDSDAGTSWDLEPNFIDAADRLARTALGQRLVVFLGAGMGRAVGLPDWTELLETLASRFGFSERECAALRKLDVLDQARLIGSRIEGGDDALGHAVAECFRGEQYSIAHALLASLPVDEFVTMNYDKLIETAASDVGRPMAVLPYEAVQDAQRWILKLHGSVDHPDDIVLTREDYLRYSDRRAALAGIVQALLITRHMVFLGFSLQDDNFHRIVDEVRRAVRGPERADLPQRFGSSVHLASDSLMTELWQRDLELIALGGDDALATASSATIVARRLEIFLDRVLFTSVDHRSHLLDPSFEGVLDDDELRLRGVLRSVVAMDRPLLATETAAPLADLLRRFGWVDSDGDDEPVKPYP